jgi:uncharacterized membrane protein required for colicin V production
MPVLGTIGWPDLVIFGVVLFAALKGWKRGFISELTGAIALAVGIGAGFQYPGMWDETVKRYTNLGPGSSHVVAMILYASVAYLIVAAIGYALGRIAKLPVIGTANALLGSGVGIVKSLVFIWAVLFVALFFPLTRDLRDDLHKSQLVVAITAPNERIDGVLKSAFPWFAKPFTDELFTRHHV